MKFFHKSDANMKIIQVNRLPRIENRGQNKALGTVEGTPRALDITEMAFLAKSIVQNGIKTSLENQPFAALSRKSLGYGWPGVELGMNHSVKSRLKSLLAPDNGSGRTSINIET